MVHYGVRRFIIATSLVFNFLLGTFLFFQPSLDSTPTFPAAFQKQIAAHRLQRQSHLLSRYGLDSNRDATHTDPTEEEATVNEEKIQRKKVYSHSKLNQHRCLNMPSKRLNASNELRNDAWHVFHFNSAGTSGEITVFGAYYDDRDHTKLQHKGKHAVRVIGDTTLIRLDVYCQLWFADLASVPYIVRATNLAIGRGFAVAAGFYQEHMYSCLIEPDMYPTHVSLGVSACSIPDIHVPITYPTRTLDRTYTVCVAVSFWHINPYQLIEWLELNRILGIEEVNIYNSSMSEASMQVLDSYAQDGFVRLHSMPAPVLNATTKYEFKLSSPASLNDCMYRNMYRSRFIVVIDFDEFIVPHKHKTYTELLDYVDMINGHSERHHSYSFRNTYFWLDNPADLAQPPYLITQLYRQRSAESPYLYAAKSFIDPRACISVFNHYCWIRYPHIKAISLDVPAALATSNHYKYCNLKEKCEKLIIESYNDDVMLKYGTLLTDAVKPVLSRFNLDLDAVNFTSLPKT